MKAPSFWSHKGMISSALLPLSALYNSLSALRTKASSPYQANIPVICVGNITSGGTGKTPVTAFIATLLHNQGYKVAILSRGYGGTQKKPLKVAFAKHAASLVGDEPLLLSQFADVIISRNRAEGARYIEDHGGYDVIVMDDGMQNPQLAKDAVLTVFDGAIGVQNNRILPAGPLRQSLSSAMPSTDLVMINGQDATSLCDHLGNLPCVSFDLAPAPSEVEKMLQGPVFAFAGIGRPKRFFDTLKNQGYQLAGSKGFGDHYQYQETDLADLSQLAKATGARLITTEKDWVRLPKDWQDQVAYLPVRLQISEKDVTVILSVITPHLA